jgi:hypothetical protein
MRREFLLTVTTLSLCACALTAQMHKVAAPEQVVRAVGVYEWTGDKTKPTASRLIPVTLFIDGALQDAGVYLARPVPFALDSGTVYEVDEAGKPEGTVDLQYATHLNATDESTTNYDDGWFGYGRFSPPQAPKKITPRKEKTPEAVNLAGEDSDRPTLVRRAGSSSSSKAGDSSANPASGGGASSTGPAPAPPDDPDRPHLSKRQDSSAPAASGGDQTSSTGGTHKDTGTANGTTAGSSASSGDVPPSDADRPTLKKRTPEEAKKARREAEQSSATGLATSLNDDPNRPTLHHGKGQQALTEAELPKLKGLPVGVHQAVAVSDAKTRPEHDFSRPWEDDAERATILAKMQALARAQLAAYAATAGPAQITSVPAKKTATQPMAARSPKSKLRHAKTAESAQQTPLEEEQLSGYTLSYGGDPTYVYMAHTPGEGAAREYVTVVAQMDVLGELKPAIQSVTDAAHLDRTPWMRLVDVVDADASNRASLLFELRGQTARQFGLYRVIAARSEQIFLTGTTQ